MTDPTTRALLSALAEDVRRLADCLFDRKPCPPTWMMKAVNDAARAEAFLSTRSTAAESDE